jgi:hypothetical protein
MMRVCAIGKLVGLAEVKFCSVFCQYEKKLNFFIEKGQPISHFEDASWISDLAFLTDVCGHLNDLNSKLQGTCMPNCK